MPPSNIIKNSSSSNSVNTNDLNHSASDESTVSNRKLRGQSVQDQSKTVKKIPAGTRHNQDHLQSKLANNHVSNISP